MQDARQAFLRGFRYGGNVEGALFVTVVEANELAAADISGTSDPYVLVDKYADRLWSNRGGTVKDLSKKKAKKTKVVKRNNLNPQWNETLKFKITPKVLQEYAGIRAQVWDWDRFTKDDFLGECAITWEEIAPLIDVATLDRDEDRRAEPSTCRFALRPRDTTATTGDDLKIQGNLVLGFSFVRKSGA